MSSQFMRAVHRLASEMPREELTQEQRVALEAGRRFGAEFVHAVRFGKENCDALAHAVFFAGRTGEDSTQILQGFLREIQRAVAGGHDADAPK